MTMNSIYMEIGERIKLLRHQKGMTQGDLSEKADISIAFLSFVESGKRKGSLDTYHHLATALGLGLDELFKNLKEDKVPRGAKIADLSVAESKAVYKLVRSLRRK
jgi:transcriptional regulator with XRE-family HTH domain